jgi:hypothetical protein
MCGPGAESGFNRPIRTTTIHWYVGMIKSALKRIYTAGVDVRDRSRYAALYTKVHDNVDPDTHMREAIEWLCRAQDHGSDRGVSYGCMFGEGFETSYPETTGYIMASFVHLAEAFAREEYLRRAIEMSDWEISIQMPEGAVMGGRVNSNPTPAMFNTGQVLIGWATLFNATKLERIRAAGTRAADWMVSLQEPAGNWIRGNSQFANAASTVYNVKAAWGLCAFGKAIGEQRYIDAAIKNAEYAVSRQLANGWFRDCCLSDANAPVLHTIAYTMQGLTGIAQLTGRQDFTRAAMRTADSLIPLMGPDGFIPGRIDAEFRGVVDWCCLTGNAQTSIVWAGLFRETQDPKYLNAMRTVNDYVMRRHDISSPDPAIRGGLAGSWPVWGEYGKYRILNWATKFFLDALLDQKEIESRVRTGAGA